MVATKEIPSIWGLKLLLDRFGVVLDECNKGNPLDLGTETLSTSLELHPLTSGNKGNPLDLGTETRV